MKRFLFFHTPKINQQTHRTQTTVRIEVFQHKKGESLPSIIRLTECFSWSIEAIGNASNIEQSLTEAIEKMFVRKEIDLLEDSRIPLEVPFSPFPTFLDRIDLNAGGHYHKQVKAAFNNVRRLHQNN